MTPNLNETCPFLGKRDDPATAIAYPSASNRCFKDQAAMRPSLGHQEEWCLRGDHTRCPVYIRGAGFTADAEVDPPGEDQVTAPPPGRQRWLIGGAVGVVALLTAAAFFTQGQMSLPSDPPAAEAAVTDGFTPITVATEIAQPTPTLSTQATLTEPSNPTITPHSIKIEPDQPFGGGIRFVVHTIAEGETFEGLARQYNTTFLAMQKVNGTALANAAVGAQIVIPVDVEKLPADLPVFVPYNVPQEIGLRELASQFGAAIDLLAQYNGMNADDTLAQGSWVLVPASQ